MTQVFKSHWYLARYKQVNGAWEVQVVLGKSWKAKWLAIDAARERGDDFTPFRGEILKQQKSLVFVTETGDYWLPRGSEASS